MLEQLPTTPNKDCNHLQPEIQQEFDPRSPTIEISRTPIIIKTPVVQIKNTDDIRRKLLKGNTIKKLTKSTEDLLSAQRKQEGILETDLDYIETDIDLVYRHKTTKYIKNTHPLNVETGFVLTLNDPRSPSCGINRTPIQVPKELTEDPRSPTVEFARTPILKLPPVEDCASKCESFNDMLDSLSLDEEKIEEIIVEPLLTVVEVKPTQSLIYEDVEVPQVVTPSRKVNKDGRTPLGVRNGGRSKSANGRLLQNSNKNEFEVGKIPIYNKNLKKLKARKVDSREQCENTPPKNVMKRRTGSAHQWDATDNTLII